MTSWRRTRAASPIPPIPTRRRSAISTPPAWTSRRPRLLAAGVAGRAREDRRNHRRERAGAGSGASASARRRRLLRIRIAAGLQGRDESDRRRRPGWTRAADRDYYLKDDAKDEGVARAVREPRGGDAELAGTREGDAQNQAKALMSTETALARASMDKVDRRDPRRCTTSAIVPG